MIAGLPVHYLRNISSLSMTNKVNRIRIQAGKEHGCTLVGMVTMTASQCKLVRVFKSSSDWTGRAANHMTSHLSCGALATK